MNQAQDNNPEIIIEFLKQTFTGGTDTVSKAEQCLATFGSNPIAFVESLLNIVVFQDGYDIGNMNIKTAASIYISTFIRTKLREKFLNADQNIQIMKLIFDALFIGTIPDHPRMHLKIALEEFYTHDPENVFKDESLTLANRNLLSKSPEKYAAALYTVQSVIGAVQSKPELVNSYYSSLSKALYFSGSILIDGLMTEIDSIKTIDATTEQSKLDQLMIHLVLGTKILAIWAETLKIISSSYSSNKITKKHNLYYKMLLIPESLIPVCTKILKLNIPSVDTQIRESIISTSGIAEFDKQANDAKTHIFKFINSVINYSYKTNSDLALINANFAQFVKGDCLIAVIETLLLFVKNPKFDLSNIGKDFSLHELLVELLSYPSGISYDKSLHAIFAESMKYLIVDTCLPLMMTTESEYNNMKDNPEEFIYLTFDCINSQNSQTYKPQACQLLETICRNVDGAISFAASILLKIIDFSMNCDNLQDIANTYPELAYFQSSRIISNCNATIRVETSILALSVLSGLIIERLDLLAGVEKILSGNYFDFYTGEKSDSKQDKEYLGNYIKFIVDCIGMGKPDSSTKTLSSIALEVFINIVDDDDGSIRLGPFIVEILAKFTEFILDYKANKFFDLLIEIIKSFSGPIAANKNTFLKFCEILAQRGEIEYKEVKNSNKSSVVLHKIWNIFIAIAERNEYLQKYQFEIESTLEVMVQHLATETSYTMDDDVLQFIAKTQMNTEMVSTFTWNLLKAFPGMLRRTKGILDYMFKAINHIVVNGFDVINQDAQAIHYLIEIGLYAMNSDSLKADELNFTEGALILQLLIQYLDPISEEDMALIIQEVTKKYETSKKKYFKAKLSGVLMTLFLKYFEKTQSIFIQLNKLEMAIQIIIGDLTIYQYHIYDRKKLFVLAMCKLILSPEAEKPITDRFNDFFEAMITILTFSKICDQKEIIKQQRKAKADKEDSSESEDEKSHYETKLMETSNKDIFLNLIQNKDVIDIPEPQIEKEDSEERDSYNESREDSSLDDEDFDDIFDDTANLKARMDEFETAIKDEDEFKIFRITFEKIKLINPNAFTELYRRLALPKQDYLREIVNLTRVENSEGKSEARKIVKIKNKKI